MALLSEPFADPGALYRTATADFVDLARSRVLAMRQALQEAASAVDGEEQALRENVRATATFTGCAAVFFVLIGVALIVMLGLSGSESRLVGGVAILPGLGFATWRVVLRRRRGQSFLFLRSDGLSFPG